MGDVAARTIEEYRSLLGSLSPEEEAVLRSVGVRDDAERRVFDRMMALCSEDAEVRDAEERRCAAARVRAALLPLAVLGLRVWGGWLVFPLASVSPRTAEAAAVCALPACSHELCCVRCAFRVPLLAAALAVASAARGGARAELCVARWVASIPRPVAA